MDCVDCVHYVSREGLVPCRYVTRRDAEWCVFRRAKVGDAVYDETDNDHGCVERDAARKQYQTHNTNPATDEGC